MQTKIIVAGSFGFVYKDVKLQVNFFPSAVAIVRISWIDVIVYCTCYIVSSVCGCNQPVGSWLENGYMDSSVYEVITSKWSY